MFVRRLVLPAFPRCLSKRLRTTTSQPLQSFPFLPKAAPQPRPLLTGKFMSLALPPTCWKSTQVNSKAAHETVLLREALPHSRDGVKLVWNDGTDHVFNYIWLRDNCKCHACVDHDTKQKRLDTPSIRLDVMPETFGISECGNTLKIAWSDDLLTGRTHVSSYDSEWLHSHGNLVSEQHFHPHKHTDVQSPVVLWNAEIIKGEMPQVEYKDVMESNEGLFQWLAGIFRYGLGLIKNAPVEEQTVLDVAQRIAYIKETSYGVLFNVIAFPQDAGHLAYTGESLPHHTDLNYREKSPGIQILHCLHSSGALADEGVSLFVDGFYVAEYLRKHNPSAFHILTSVPVEFKIVYKENTYKHHVPVICIDNNGEIEEIHVNNRTMGPLHSAPHLVTPFYSAYKAMTDKIRDSVSEVRFQLEEGDIIAFNNRRVLHGRTGYNPRTVGRHLQGCYIEYDEFLSKLQSLESQFIEKQQ